MTILSFLAPLCLAGATLGKPGRKHRGLAKALELKFWRRQRITSMTSELVLSICLGLYGISFRFAANDEAAPARRLTCLLNSKGWHPEGLQPGTLVEKFVPDELCSSLLQPHLSPTRPTISRHMLSPNREPPVCERLRRRRDSLLTYGFK